MVGRYRREEAKLLDVRALQAGAKEGFVLLGPPSSLLTE